MITLSKISKSFGQTEAVKKINLSIKPGEIVGLLGPNGAGKTTTLRMLAGVLPPSKGEVKIDGQNFLEDGQAVKAKIGYLPENNPLYEDMTVEEHMIFWSRMKNIGKGKPRQEAIRYAVESTGIETVYYRFISELSKGFRQRVGLAQAILNKPEILILDEPTEGLDPNQRKDIQKLLSELQKSRTVIVSSHVLGEISKLANRIVIVHQGQVVGDDTPENLVKSQAGLQEIQVEVTGKAVLAGLKKLPQVKSVKKVDKDTYEIISASKTDLRLKIFDMAVKNKWKLLETKKVERQLEDVFSELTQE